MKKLSSRRFFKGIQDYEKITGKAYDYNLPSYDTGVAQSQFDDYGVLDDVEQQDKGWFSSFLDFSKGVASDIYNHYKNAALDVGEQIVNAPTLWNLFHERRLESEQSSVLNELLMSNFTLDDLDGVQKYIDNINEYKNLTKLYNNASSDAERIQISLRLNELIPSIKEQENFYKTLGKESNVLVDLFFDPNKANMTINERLDNVFGHTVNKHEGNFLNKAWESIKEAPLLFVESIDNTITALKGIPEAFSNKNRGNSIRRWIQKSGIYNSSTDKWFNSYYNNPSSDINKLQESLNKYKDIYNRQKKEKELEARHLNDILLNGTWYFNKKYINNDIKQKAEERQYGLLGMLKPTNIGYSFVELGSSFGDWYHMAASMGVDAAIGLATKKIVSGVMARAVPGAGQALLAADLANIANKTLKAELIALNVNFLGGALATTSSLYFTKEMRRWETNAESMDAISSRVLEESMNRNVNLDKVLEEGSKYLKQIGIDIDGKDEINIIKDILSYNAPITDKEFNNIKNESRKGINKLINSNNALAAMDYWEMLPFTTYTRSFMRNFGSIGFRTPKNGLMSPKLLKTIGQDTWIAGSNELRRAVSPTLRAEIDRKVDNVAKKFISNPANQLRLSRTSKFFTKRIGQMMSLGAKEGLEEGVQHLLQERYQSGEYDEYNKLQSMFNLPSLLDISRISADAIANYIGFKLGDSDNGDQELVRAMEIGAVTAPWFLFPRHVLSNIMSDDTKTKFYNYLENKRNGFNGDGNVVISDNFRGLIKQLKNDKIVGKIVADSYGQAEDEEKIGTFFDAISTKHSNRDRLILSLLDFKLFKGPGVTDDFIDKDIKLLNATHNLYNSEVTDDIIKALNIDKNSNKHKQYIQQAVTKIMDADNALNLYKEDYQKYNQERLDFVNNILNSLGDVELLEVGRLADLILGTNVTTESPNLKLATLVEKIKNEYDSIINGDVYKQYRQQEKLKFINSKNAENLAIKNLKELNENKQEFSQEEINEEKNRIANERFVDQSVEEFITDAVQNIVQLEFLNQYLNIRGLFKNREKLLSFIQKELGNDINYDLLSGMIHMLDNNIKDIKENINNKVTKLNYILQKINPEFSVSALQLVNPYGIEIPNELKKSMQTLIINKALSDVLTSQASAYNTGLSNPNGLRLSYRKPSWKELTRQLKDYYIDLYKLQKEGTDLIDGINIEDVVGALYNEERMEYYNKMNKFRKDYNRTIDEIKKISKNENLSNEDLDEILSYRQELYDIEEESAKLYIENALLTRIDRRLIAHIELLNDRPVIYDDLEEAFSGNKLAQAKIEEEVEKEVNSAEEKIIDNQLEELELNQDENVSDVNEDFYTQLQNGELNLNESNLNTLEISDEEKLLRETYDPEDPDLLIFKTTGNNLDIQEEVEESELGEPENLDIYDLTNEEIQESNLNLDINSIQNKKDKSFVVDKKEIESDYLSETFFYPPTAETPPKLLTENGKPIKLLNNATLKTGKELSEKLVQPGWFENTDKYYVIAADVNHVDMRNADNLVVALIIQDGKDAYATFLRSISRKYKDGDSGIVTYDNKTLLVIERLRELRTTQKYKDAENRIEARDKARRTVYKDYNPNEISPTIDKINYWFDNEASLDAKDDALDLLRFIMAENQPIMTERAIKNLINKLIDARNTIIDACVEKGLDGKYVILNEGYPIVRPENVSISNGSLNVQINNGKHVFRNVTDGGFNMSKDIEELTSQIEEDEVEIGLGVGLNYPEGAEYSIVHLDEDKQGSWDPQIGKGLAGQIYVMTEAANGNTVPVMLSLVHFNSDQVVSEDINGERIVLPENIQEHIGLDGKIKEGEDPTIAEFIFRIITRRFHVSNFGNVSLDPSIIDEIKDLLVHDAEKTEIDKKSLASNLFLARKQLYFDTKGMLHIALPDARGVWRKTILTQDLLFDPNYSDNRGNTSEGNRKKVIAAIATNLHWNTDRNDMVSDMHDRYPNFMRYLYNYFNNNKLEAEISLFGIKDFTFKKQDFFNEDMTPKHVIQIAWMLKNEKMVTDKGIPLFKDPFVFASGVKPASEVDKFKYKAEVAKYNEDLKDNKKESSKDNKESKENNKDTKSKDTNIKTILTNEIAKQRILNITERMVKFNKGTGQLLSKDFEKAITDMLNLSEKEALKILDDKGFIDVSILDVDVWYDANNSMSNKELKDKCDDAIKRYVDEFNKTHESKIKTDDFKVDTKMNKEDTLRSKNVLLVTIKKNGEKKAVFYPAKNIINMSKNKRGVVIRGIYSTNKNKFSSKLKPEEARKFVEKTLGLSQDQLIITNAIMRSMEGKEVFGVTRAATDIINDQIRVLFVLQKNANKGVYFHEAFHYVNLLLNNKIKRLKIYEEYRKHHMFSSKLSDQVIEERLAESFRRYAYIKTETGLIPTIKRLFNNILDFVFQYRKTNIIRQLYNDILEGGYRQKTIDEESYKEFQKAYQNGAFMNAHIPNQRKEISDNFKYILNYDLFYDISESVAKSYIHFVLDSNLEDTINKGKDSFLNFLKYLEDATELDRTPYVQDILDNPIAFKYTILRVLRKYGIKASTKDLLKYNKDKNSETSSEDIEERESEDRYENTWDIDHFEMSVKDNVANRAKLFFSQIPAGKINIDGEFEVDLDPYLNMESYVSFDEAYSLIMRYLSNYSTYEDIYNRVKELSSSSSFFRSFLQCLDDIDGDIELLNLVASTIKKQTPNVLFITQKTEKRKNNTNIEDSSDNNSDDVGVSSANTNVQVVLDQEKTLEITNDSAISPMRNTLKLWSQLAYRSAMFSYDHKHNHYVVDEDFCENVVDLYKNLKRLVSKKPKYLTEEQISNALTEAKSKFVLIYNIMSVPIDSQILDRYIKLNITNNKFGDIKEQYNSLRNIIIKKDKKGGNINFFINLLKSNSVRGEEKFIHRIFKDGRDFDSIYRLFSINSEIGILAEIFNSIYPDPAENSVTVPGGKTIFPVNENNAASDRIRWINLNFELYVDKMLNTPYCQNSIVLKTAKELLLQKYLINDDLLFRLNLIVGMLDKDNNEGSDYFEITPLEDAISKMIYLNDNLLVFPTMADKKTFYTTLLYSKSNNTELVQSYFSFPHDVLTKYRLSEDGFVKPRRFSNKTIEIFIGYFKDELNALDLYYNKNNIKQLLKNKGLLKKNFHGKVKNNRMDFSGNGGLFRYFYDLGLDEDLNLNERLEFAYNKQLYIENPESGEGLDQLRDDEEELDGFELVRKELLNIKNKYLTKNGIAKSILYDDINKLLFSKVDEAMIEYEKKGPILLLEAGISKAIPKQILDEYKKRFNKLGIKCYTTNPYKIDKYGDADDLALSVIGNYVIGQAISVIEVEKILSGDPAFYKWKYYNLKKQVTKDGFSTSVRVLEEKDTDKIKRLGSLLSPGLEIRTDYSNDILLKYPELKNKNYTVANISDISAKSLHLEELKTAFKQQMLSDWVRNNIKDGETEKLAINRISKSETAYIDKQVDSSLSPYKDINVADALVLIRPALYRKIRIGLGLWKTKPIDIEYKDSNGDIKYTQYSDEIAYNIIEKDGSWLSDPKKAAIVKRLELYPLKMSYFLNDFVKFSKNTNENNMALPIYNKMAIFPVFKFMYQSKTGKLIYDRMNMKDNEIDMITFESAVKVGLNLYKYSPYDSETTSLSTLDNLLSKKSNVFIKNNGKISEKNLTDDLINVHILSLDNLRMLLNTEAHKDRERKLGTLMFKILFSNIYDDVLYQDGRLGSEIKQDIMSCINKLTEIGVKNVKKEFFNEDGSISADKVRDYIKRIIQNNDIGPNAEEILNNGYSAASLMVRDLIEQSLFKLISGDVIDIKMEGGSAILQSVFGFVSYDHNKILTKVEDVDGYWVPNNGRELNWFREDGSCEIMLSANFFKKIVPKKYQNTPKLMREWLIENDIICGIKKDGTESKPKPIGVGYRIPTLGMSSTFAFVVADILPESCGDVIVVPREFTGQTGSDMDVDKIFLATLQYKGGKLLKGDNSIGGIRNKLLKNYISVLTDSKNIAQARASIDTITSIVKKEVVPLTKNNNVVYAKSMYELMPQFLSLRKREYSVGKNGIGPFALNITNIALTLFSHLSIKYDSDNDTTGFKFKPLDKITGEDGLRISDWLSAMVNAHVDVAKDPYIFDLNINKATYNHVNFLFRSGKGKSTLLFIALPILKRYSDIVNSTGGHYGQHLSIKDKKLSSYEVMNNVLKEYTDFFKKFSDTLNKKDKLIWEDKLQKLNDGEVNWYEVFDENKLKHSLLSGGFGSIEDVYYQIFVLKSYQKIDKYAQALSNLVRMSKIDTKKFGNNIITNMNFLNSYNNFIYGKNDVEWTLTDKKVNSTQALEYYFDESFLDKKLKYTVELLLLILQNLTYTATDEFRKVFTSVMSKIYGKVDLQIGSNNITAYNEVMSEDAAKSIGNALESIIRNRKIYDFVSRNNIDLFLLEGAIDITFGGDPISALKYTKELFFGDNNIFNRVSNLINNAKNNPTDEKYIGIVNNLGTIINELLDFLVPIPSTEENPIGRFTFSKNKRSITGDEKSRLSSSFDYLLSHPNEDIRNLAHDLVIYAYYSTYDTNVIGSFFDIVPQKYRAIYDTALHKGLDSVIDNSNLSSIDSYIDTLCRNYYFDDAIVPLYTIYNSNNKYISSGSGAYLGSSVRDYNNKTKIPSFIITSKFNSSYIKIIENNQYYIYKGIERYILQKKKGGDSNNIWYCYIPVLKLGNHSGNNHVYEYFNEGIQDSMFDRNKLPEDLDIDDIRDEINNFLSISEKRAQRPVKVESIINNGILENIYRSESIKNILYSDLDFYDTIYKEEFDENNDINLTINLSKSLKQIQKDLNKYLTEDSKGEQISILIKDIPQVEIEDLDLEWFIDEKLKENGNAIYDITKEELLEHKNNITEEVKLDIIRQKQQNYISNIIEDIILSIPNVYIYFENNNDIYINSIKQSYSTFENKPIVIIENKKVENNKDNAENNNDDSINEQQSDDINILSESQDLETSEVDPLNTEALMSILGNTINDLYSDDKQSNKLQTKNKINNSNINESHDTKEHENC